jgi:hypothetical protein
MRDTSQAQAAGGTAERIGIPGVNSRYALAPAARATVAR